MSITRRFHVLSLVLSLGLLACSPDEPVTPSLVQAPPEPLPALRTGTVEPAPHDEQTPAIHARWRDETHEYLELILQLDEDSAGTGVLRPGGQGSRVELMDAMPGDLAVLATSERVSPAHILLRRALAPGDSPVSGALWIQSWQPAALWERWPFKTTTPSNLPADPSLKARWLEALAKHFEHSTGHPWYAFAAGRLQTLPNTTPIAAGNARNLPARRTELSRLMETTTGVMSMQEALQYDRGLRLDRAMAERSIAVETLAAPDLPAHPFTAMQAQLPNPDAGIAEPLAAAVPAEFWYARVDDIRLLLRMLDEAEAWITPVTQILQSSPEDRRLSTRYQTQLGLQRSGLAKLLGHTVVGPVALTGSDPYLREGSDVTLIFSVKQQAVFDQELTRHLADYTRRTPGLLGSSREHSGIQIQVHQDPQGIVRQQRAQIGELAIVSNSAAALNRVLDTLLGHTPSLANEADLRYMLARDPGQHQGLLFFSDRFIANVIGPQQKIQAARRQQALAELLTPGYAALLHGWLHGVAPTSTEALLSSGLLDAQELRHADGTPIQFAPGTAAVSTWGRAASLTPLIDLPVARQVSVAEQQAYSTFVSTYQQYWKQFIDPVAIRLDLVEQDSGTTARIDVRILPLISGTDYSEIEAVVGDTRIQVPALQRGAQGVWAVGQDARLRSELDGLLRSATGRADTGLGWLGNWVALGVDDRAALVELLSYQDRTVQLALPTSRNTNFEDLELWRRIGKFPLYVAAEVKNPVMLVATLTGLRTMLGQVAPGMIEWGEAGRYRDLPIVRIGVSRSAPMLPDPQIADAVGLHYVQTGQAIVFALNPQTLHTVIDRLLDGNVPQTVSARDTDDAAQAQFVFEAHSPRGAPIWTALLWLIQGQANAAQDHARLAAEVLLRGDPSVAGDATAFDNRALEYFGAIPQTTMGNSAFVLSREGASDATIGSTLRPTFVDLPMPGSPVERLMQSLQRLRGEVSFDHEPKAAGIAARSLHTRFELSLSPDAERGTP